MKLEVFMDLTTKRKSMKPEYTSCICSPSVLGWIQMLTEKGKLLGNYPLRACTKGFENLIYKYNIKYKGGQK